MQILGSVQNLTPSGPLEARLRAVQAIVDQARLISPIEGTVMSVNHGVGDSIVPGEVEIVVADLGSLHIDTSVDELDVGDVVIGQSVEITLDAFPELVLVGSVAGIDLAPEIGSTSTQYPVRVELESLDELVRVGMTAGLSILVADNDNVVLIPNWALGFDPETGEIIVFVGDGENRERTGDCARATQRHGERGAFRARTRRNCRRHH